MTTTIDTLRTVCTAQHTVPTPLGPLLLVRTERGLAGAWFEGQKHHPGEMRAAVAPNDPLLQRAAYQLERYFGGYGEGFDLPLDLHGTGFQRGVWMALLGITVGTTRSYGEIARQVGASAAVRAVGGAVGRNPLSVIVPCHRVVGSDGTLTGYAGGMDRKSALLALEGAVLMSTTQQQARSHALPQTGSLFDAGALS